MKKLIINFLIISLIGIIFFRPQIFKEDIKLSSKTAYYFHGFPITTIVKVNPISELNEYEIKITPIKSNIWIGGVESDYETFNLWDLKLPKDWTISGPENKAWAWINQYDENNKNENME